MEIIGRKIGKIGADVTSVEKFNELLLILIDARNAISKDVKDSWTSWESSVLNKIDGLISRVLKNEPMKSIFKVEQDDRFKKYPANVLRYNENGFTLLNETIKQLKAENRLNVSNKKI